MLIVCVGESYYGWSKGHPIHLQHSTRLVRIWLTKSTHRSRAGKWYFTAYLLSLMLIFCYQEPPRRLRYAQSKSTAYASYSDHERALLCLKVCISLELFSSILYSLQNIQRPPTGSTVPAFSANLAPPRFFDAKNQYASFHYVEQVILILLLGHLWKYCLCAELQGYLRIIYADYSVGLR